MRSLATNGSNSSNLNLNHSQFTSGGNIIVNSITNNNQALEEASPYYSILERNTVLDALYDSDARYDPPKCHPDTREAVLNQIRTWAISEDSQPVMWIRGGAGAGKSAIAQTLSEGWAKEGLLAASFYFFRTARGRNEKKYFIATLAYQMTESIPGFRPLIEEAIGRTPRIFERNLPTQMQALIIKPLITLSQSKTIGARLVVIDGLDECRHSYAHQSFEQQQKEILEVIHLASSEKGFPLRFLIASRPEPQIREIFDHGILESISSRTVLNDTQNPSADIELYIRCSLAEIRRVHSHLESSWPPEAVIQELVVKSSGHFIYAAVVVRYLSSPRTDPEAALTALRNIADSDIDQPFAQLDALYMHILEQVAPQSLRKVMDIFGLMLYPFIGRSNWVLFDEDIICKSPYWIAKYLFMSPGQLSVHLVDLHSILNIPSSAASKSAPISFLHASFSEFLTQSSRSQRFFIEEKPASSRILSFSIRHLLIQLLSRDNGKEYGYSDGGFAMQVGYALELHEPEDDALEALKAILNQDERNFNQYVHEAELSHFGTTRRSMHQIQCLYQRMPMYGPRRPMVLIALKRHQVPGFVPIDPAHDDMHPKRYAGTLDWFCDASQGTSASESSSQYDSSEESDSLDNDPTYSPGEQQDIYNSDQGEPDDPQPYQPVGSKCRLTLDSHSSPEPERSRLKLIPSEEDPVFSR